MRVTHRYCDFCGKKEEELKPGDRMFFYAWGATYVNVSFSQHLDICPSCADTLTVTQLVARVEADRDALRSELDEQDLRY